MCPLWKWSGRLLKIRQYDGSFIGHGSTGPCLEIFRGNVATPALNSRTAEGFVLAEPYQLAKLKSCGSEPAGAADCLTWSEIGMDCNIREVKNRCETYLDGNEIWHMLHKAAKTCIFWMRQETVLCVAVLLAVVSCFFVPPSGAYLSYIDWNTLALLFSLMAVMRGLQKVGFFAYTANFLLKRITSTRTLLLILVFLPFFFSMVITNDVALITFVPFGLIVLKMAGQERLAVPQVVLQTVAANLGSMLTPVGNPQNLYLYNKSGIGFGELCGWMLPYVLASGVCLALIIVFRKPVRISGISLTAPLGSPAVLLCCTAGFVLCLLGIFKLIPPVIVAVAIAGFLLVKDRDTLFKIDYSLLATFFAFFIFVGNVAGITAFQSFLTSILAGRVELVAVLTSQITSNVPAALLLSGFTTQWRSLIVGCNLGGLGTLIASMASLISYKMVVKEFPGQRKRYFWRFTLCNIGLLLFLSLVWYCMEHFAARLPGVA